MAAPAVTAGFVCIPPPNHTPPTGAAMCHESARRESDAPGRLLLLTIARAAPQAGPAQLGPPTRWSLTGHRQRSGRERQPTMQQHCRLLNRGLVRPAGRSV